MSGFLWFIAGFATCYLAAGATAFLAVRRDPNAIAWAWWELVAVALFWPLNFLGDLIPDESQDEFGGHL